ncbi:ricin B lectin domain-containing protein [Ganoderma leucocontextum]|nr:ricin B lectin domain-containing protein [Ganoderma leucocontextum]
MVESGRTYKLVNAKAGTVLDLSGADNRQTIGYGYHGGDNQKWALEQEDNQWLLRNVASGLYLSVEGLVEDGTSVLATGEHFKWDIWPDEEDSSTFRLFVPNTQFNMDLSDHGSAVPGTHVVIWTKWHPGKNQTWRFEEVPGIASDYLCAWASSGVAACVGAYHYWEFRLRAGATSAHYFYVFLLLATSRLFRGSLE